MLTKEHPSNCQVDNSTICISYLSGAIIFVKFQGFSVSFCHHSKKPRNMNCVTQFKTQIKRLLSVCVIRTVLSVNGGRHGKASFASGSLHS